MQETILSYRHHPYVTGGFSLSLFSVTEETQRLIEISANMLLNKMILPYEGESRAVVVSEEQFDVSTLLVFFAYQLQVIIPQQTIYAEIIAQEKAAFSAIPPLAKRARDGALIQEKNRLLHEEKILK